MDNGKNVTQYVDLAMDNGNGVTYHADIRLALILLVVTLEYAKWTMAGIFRMAQQPCIKGWGSEDVNGQCDFIEEMLPRRDS